MKNLPRRIMVADIETDSTDPDTCEMVQLSALIIDPNKLEVIPDSEFDIYICPGDINKEDYISLHKDTLNFHAKNRNMNIKDLLDDWRKGIDTKTAVNSFVQYLNKWNPKKSFTNNFIFAGANPEFDLTILKRYFKEFNLNLKTHFWLRDTTNVQHHAFMWLEQTNDPPLDYKMDTLRSYFGIPDLNAHNSLQDVRDEAALLIRFLKLYKAMAKKVKFRDAFKEGL